MLFTQLVTANLQTQILGREIEYYTRVDSTNLEARKLLEEGAEEGTLILTDNQTAGRGRHGESWFSGPGKGLAFSVILKPNMRGKPAGVLSLAVGLAVTDAIENFRLVSQLKWPNDVLLSGKKCGGILLETRFQGDVMTSAIAGIGINVNESQSEFPESIRNITTSIAIEKQSPAQRELILAWTLNSLERRYAGLKSGDASSIISDWENRCSHIGKTVSFNWKGENAMGIFEGVAQDGEAIIHKLDNSTRLTLSSEEIADVREV
ncbi:MAG: biotin--[acetyl-CoA-carboxylase] ligase [Candidatus Neomarinimicrobiota bacterium]